jgi:putative NADPH-quinone reductase
MSQEPVFGVGLTSKQTTAEQNKGGSTETHEVLLLLTGQQQAHERTKNYRRVREAERNAPTDSVAMVCFATLRTPYLTKGARHTKQKARPSKKAGLHRTIDHQQHQIMAVA